MHCVGSSEELASLMDGELSPAGAAEVERHVADCAACRRKLSQLRQTASLVKSLAEVAPPADLRARLERKAAGARSVAPVGCSSVCEMLDAYAHGELPAETTASVHAHVSECVPCSRELSRLEQTCGLVREVAEVSPPQRIRQRVRGEVARRLRPIYARPTFRGMIATAAAAVAAAALMLALRMPTVTQGPVVAGRQPKAVPTPAATAPLADAKSGAAMAAQPATDERGRAAIAAMPGLTHKPAQTAGLGSLPNVRLLVKAAAPEAASPSTLPAMTSGGERVATADLDAVRQPAETPAPQVTAAYVGPALEPEATGEAEGLPRPHPAREAVRASVAPAMESPLSEVRRILSSQQRSEAPTLKPKKREPDRFASGPIAPWGF